MAKLSHCDRAHVAHRAETICHPALHRKIVCWFLIRAQTFGLGSTFRSCPVQLLNKCWHPCFRIIPGGTAPQTNLTSEISPSSSLCSCVVSPSPLFPVWRLHTSWTWAGTRHSEPSFWTTRFLSPSHPASQLPGNWPCCSWQCPQPLLLTVTFNARFRCPNDGPGSENCCDRLDIGPWGYPGPKS